MQDGEDLHPNAPRMTMLVEDWQVPALKASAESKGLHLHANVPKPEVPPGHEMPDAEPGHQWVTICNGVNE